MSARSIGLDDTLQDYLLSVCGPHPEPLHRLREETASLPEARMQISREQGRLMMVLVRAIGARRALEIGTFTGYSALAVALALPEDGRLIACDVSEEWTRIGRKHWEDAGVAHKIDLRIAPALQTLDGLLAEGAAGTFDFAFIDADKPTYPAYYERVLRLLRAGGLLAVDNVLWGGRLADPDCADETAEALRAFNRMVSADDRVTMCVVPIGDGLTLAVKNR